MKNVLMFIQASCPYCKQALNWMEELKKENTNYSEVEINIIDELVEPRKANEFDYYYVPTYYVNEVKVHEGAATKEKVKAVFEKALQ